MRSLWMKHVRANIFHAALDKKRFLSRYRERYHEIKHNDGVSSVWSLQKPSSSDFQVAYPCESERYQPGTVGDEVLFYWTVKKYSSEVASGAPYGVVNSTYVNMTQLTTSEENIVKTPDDCRLAIKHVLNNDTKCKNIVAYSSYISLQECFALTDFSLTGVGLNDTRSTGEFSWNYNTILMQCIISKVGRRK